MAGIKIITVLKDDTLQEILDLFRQAPQGEVIFVLPKNSKVFRKEDHFATFASEASSGGKTIALMTPDTAVGAMARAFGFAVLGTKAKGKKSDVEKAAAALVSSPPPADEDKHDTSEDAFQDDVVVGNGEKDNILGEDEDEEDAEVPPGFHVEDENGPLEELAKAPATELEATLAAAVDGVRRGGKVHEVPVPKRPEKAQPVPVQKNAEGNPDYIDAVWRDKLSNQPGLGALFGRGAAASGKKARTSKRSISRMAALGILGAAVVVLGGAVFLVSGKATVTLIPTAKALSEEVTIQTSDSFSSVDSNVGKLPGQLVSVSKSATKTVTATGKRDVASKARGTITVFNTYSSTPQSLVATTRFATADGLVFRTLQSISVPGSTVKNGAVIPGQVTVDVIADKPGATYNAPAGKFTVVAFTEKGDADKAAKIYGTSTVAMAGGANGPSAVVTADDYQSALDGATTDAKKAITDAVAAQAGMQILETAVPTIDQTTSTAKADDAADKVSVTVTASLKTVAFRPGDLAQLIRDMVLKKDHFIVVPEQVKLSYHNVVFKSDTGVLSFTVNVAGPGYSPLDVAAIASDIAGKNGTQVRDYFANRADIASAMTDLTPPWKGSVPKETTKISVIVHYEQPSATDTP